MIMKISSGSNFIKNRGYVMEQLKVIFKSGLFVLIMYLVIILTILMITEMQPVRADMVRQPIVTTVDDVQYLRLTDAPPQRDITRQRIAPVEEPQ